MDPYRYYIAVEVIPNRGELSTCSRRVRPLPGQGLNQNLRVQCPKEMRFEYPIGTVFKIIAQWASRQGTVFIQSSHLWPYEKIDLAEAEEMIEKMELGFYPTAKI